MPPVHRGLEQALLGAPDISVFHGLEIREQRTFGEQLVERLQFAVDGRVVDEHIRVLRAGVKALHLHIHGRAGVVVGEVVKDILSSGELEHLCDIIGGFAHICCTVRCDIEECGGLAGGRLVKDGSEGVELLVIERLRLLLLSCEHAVQLDPLHAAEGIAFVARALDEHGDAEPFELFLDLGRVVDHRGLEREVAVRVADGFIVRGAVSCRRIRCRRGLSWPRAPHRDTSRRHGCRRARWCRARRAKRRNPLRSWRRDRCCRAAAGAR